MTQSSLRDVMALTVSTGPLPGLVGIFLLSGCAAMSEPATPLLRGQYGPQQHVDFGLAYAVEGKPKVAIQHFEAALRIDPRHERARLALAGVYWQTGQLNLARQLYLEVLGVNEDSVETLNNLAMLHLEDTNGTNLSQALVLARRACKLSPERWECWDTAGSVHERLGNYRAAILSFQRAQQLLNTVNSDNWVLIEKKLAKCMARRLDDNSHHSDASESVLQTKGD